MTGNFDIGREGKQDIEDDRHKTRLGKNEGPKRPREQQRRSHQLFQHRFATGAQGEAIFSGQKI